MLERRLLFLARSEAARRLFQHQCGELFGPLLFASRVEEVEPMLALGNIELMVIDLAGFDRSSDQAELVELLQGQPRLRCMALCPYNESGWLFDLMQAGLQAYALAPFADGELRKVVAEFAVAEDEPAMLQSITPDGLLQDVNQTWLQVMQYQRGEVLGRPFAQFLAEQSRHAMHAGQSESVQCLLQRKDGVLLEVALLSRPTFDERGHLFQTRCELHDLKQVLQRTQTLSRLLAKEQELKALLMCRANIQQVLMGVGDRQEFATKICQELCKYPGVVHAGLFMHGREAGLQLLGQYSCKQFDIAARLGASTHLESNGLNRQCPGLISALSGDLVFFDRPERTGHAGLISGLREHGIEMVIGIPVPDEAVVFGESQPPLGALAVMFDRAQPLSYDWLHAFAGLAGLVSFGFKVLELTRIREQLLKEMTYLAASDLLTGAANRRRGEEVLRIELDRSSRMATPLSVLMFDIDHFKRINDQFGHAAGDTALKETVATVRSALRASDVLARWGGEEFLIIAPGATQQTGQKVAEKVRRVIERRLIPGCQHITISLGLAQWNGEENMDALLARADGALYQAKQDGRNCLRVAEVVKEALPQ